MKKNIVRKVDFLVFFRSKSGFHEIGPHPTAAKWPTIIQPQFLRFPVAITKHLAITKKSSKHKRKNCAAKPNLGPTLYFEISNFCERFFFFRKKSINYFCRILRKIRIIRIFRSSGPIWPVGSLQSHKTLYSYYTNQTKMTNKITFTKDTI